MLTPTVDQLPQAWRPLVRPDEPSTGPSVTPDEIDLIKRTVANGASADELKLYLFDCKRQGVHPLDKLVHFTKRLGKYTPITSIDFMRTRAADSGEYAGNDDAVFVMGGGQLVSATVTVWRVVQGQRCSFAATARWSEYKPDAGTSGRGDVMWLKMPHTMLAKCAEALALRKGFPRQLAGLYAKEEMDQADNPRGFVVEAPAVPSTTATHPSQPRDVDATDAELGASVQNAPESGHFPPGAVYIHKVEGGFGNIKAFIEHSGMPNSLNGREGLAIYKDALVTLASEVCQAREPVVLELKQAASGKSYVTGIRRVPKPPTDAELDSEAERQALAEDAGDIF